MTEANRMTQDNGAIPIDDAAKDGSEHIIESGLSRARAYWINDMWAFASGLHGGAVEQVDFEPTHYVVTPLRKAK